MVLSKLLAVLIVAVLVLGGSAYLAYEVFWKPGQLDEQERVEIEAQALLPPPPHPSLALYKQATELLREGNTGEAVNRLTTLLENETPVEEEAKAILGEINLREFLSPVPGPRKIEYTVVKGDSLSRISSKTGVGMDLIFRANNLSNINLQIGQVLVIPQLDLQVEVDRQKGTLTLTNAGRFFKEYKLLGANVPGLSQTAPTQTSVADKMAMHDDEGVPFGDKKYAAAEKLVLLGSGGATLKSMPNDAETPPSGLVLDPADLEEIFVLVSRGTPFTIR